MIAEEGTDASLRNVARRAGVGIGTLYRHFPTREGAAGGGGRRRLRRAALADRLLAEEPSPRAALAMAAPVHGELGACQGLSGSVLSGLNDPASELHVSAEAMHLAATRLLTRAQEAGEVRAGITAADVITMSAAASWVAQISGAGPARMLDVIMDGLTPALGLMIFDRIAARCGPADGNIFSRSSCRPGHCGRRAQRGEKTCADAFSGLPAVAGARRGLRPFRGGVRREGRVLQESEGEAPGPEGPHEAREGPLCEEVAQGPRAPRIGRARRRRRCGRRRRRGR